MEEKEQKEIKFPGFPPENQTWDFPTVLNGYVHLLTGAEFKILWYIVRHTYGWQKTEDIISYKQFKNGIQKKDGTWIDRGTGLSDPSISKALKSLEEKGFIEIPRKRAGKKLINVYRLRKVDLRNFRTPTKETLEHPLKKIKNHRQSLTKQSISISKDIDTQSSSKGNDVSTSPKSPSPPKIPWTKEMLIWLEEQQGAKFANCGKQLKALGNLKKAGYTTEQIKECYKKMMKDDFWKSRHPDFVNIANNITKFIKKVDALEEARKLAHQ